jgi:ABC-type lipoprotein export system ATPase subunit
MFELKQVTKVYPLDGVASVTAVREVSLSVRRGEFVVITGRSGSGKTTVLNLMAGLTQPTAGRVEVDGADLWSMTDREQSAMRNWRIGFVFQFPSLLPSLTALENVLLPLMFKGGVERGAGTEHAIKLLEMVGLADKVAALPRQLSAGQQQRVVIARSLINEPEVLVADEPTSNLDEETEREIMATFEKAHSQRGVTVVMVTHTQYLGTRGTRRIEMAEGRVVKETPS